MVILTNFIAFCILLRKTTALSGAGFRSGACACCMPYSLLGALCCSLPECASLMHMVLLCWPGQCYVGAHFSAYLRCCSLPLQLWLHECFICHHCLGPAAGGDCDVGRERHFLLVPDSQVERKVGQPVHCHLCARLGECWCCGSETLAGMLPVNCSSASSSVPSQTI